MRINKFVALASGLSRRGADAAIAAGRVHINGKAARAGQEAAEHDTVTLDGTRLSAPALFTTVMLNKPARFVVSREGQGAQTIYALLPPELHHLKPVGRLDKDSSGLLLLTNDGNLAQALTHPRQHKPKVYEIRLNKPLQPLHRQMVSDHGVQLADGPSKFELERLRANNDTEWRIRMHEGRNRQIRRTFATLGYTVTRLHRTQFGPYTLGKLRSGAYQQISGVL